MLPPSRMLTNKKRAIWCSIFFLLLAAFLAGCKPAGPRALLDGKRLIEKKQYAQAVEKLKLATSSLSTNAQAWNYLGLAYQYIAENTNAALAYQRALLLNPDLLEAHYNLGCLWLEENRLEQAKSEFTAYTLRRPNGVEGWLKLGTAQLRAHESANAEKSFLDALKISPQNPEALNGLGLAQMQRNRPRDAAQFFNNALKQQPDYAPAMLNLATVNHVYLNNRPFALRQYRSYLALAKDAPNAEAVNALVNSLEQEFAAAARPTPTNAVVLSNPTAPKPPPTNTPSRPTTTVATVPPKVQTTAAPPAEVKIVKVAPETPIKTVRDIPPPSTPVTNTIVSSSTATTNSPDVITEGPMPTQEAKRGFFQRIFQRAPESAARPTPLPDYSSTTPPVKTESPRPAPPTPRNPPPEISAPKFARYRYHSIGKLTAGNRAPAEKPFNLGVDSQQAGRLAEAMQFYRQATQADPSYYEAYYNFGLAATQAGNLPAALIGYESALVLRPESLDARYNFALALKQSNYPVDAANELEKIMAKYPNEARTHLALGNLYAQQLAQPAKAREHYLKVLENDPDNPQAAAIHYWLTSNH
jgi:tetratricopeptide (TPR) repeat protein